MTAFDEVTVPPSVVRDLTRQRTVIIADIGGSSQQGLRRSRNEDAWGFEAGRAVVVADGMGGREAGDTAAHATVAALLQHLSGDISDWRLAINAVNADVHEAGVNAEVSALGAVAVGLRCADDRVTIVHVGDARAYRLRGGQIQQLTRDHSIAEAMADLGVRKADTNLPRRQLAALTSYFGSPGSADEFSVHELSVHAGDRIVLCSDGVHGSVRMAAWQLAATASTPGDAALLLVDDAAESGATDDRTAVVIDLDIAYETSVGDSA